METFVNKVVESGLVTLDLEVYFPSEEVKTFDMKDHLFMGLILKEKDFREALKTLELEEYRDKLVNITCSADAVIPMWAYMLAATVIEPFAKNIIFGTAEEMQKIILLKNISAIDPNEFHEKRIVVKGCGDKQIPEIAYVEISRLLRPVAKSIMYGEPCSTVPIYKKR